MKEGLGVFLLKISVALYLIVNGVLGITKNPRGDFSIIFGKLIKGDVSILVVLASIVALVAGIALLLELFKVELPFLDTLLLIVAVIWAVYVLVEIIVWIKDGFGTPWEILQRLAVHFMVLASLLTATKKF